MTAGQISTRRIIVAILVVASGAALGWMTPVHRQDAAAKTETHVNNLEYLSQKFFDHHPRSSR